MGRGCVLPQRKVRLRLDLEFWQRCHRSDGNINSLSSKKGDNELRLKIASFDTYRQQKGKALRRPTMMEDAASWQIAYTVLAELQRRLPRMHDHIMGETTVRQPSLVIEQIGRGLHKSLSTISVVALCHCQPACYAYISDGPMRSIRSPAKGEEDNNQCQLCPHVSRLSTSIVLR